MIVKTLIPAALLAGAVFVTAQSKPELTARELFYAPASVSAASTPKKPVVGTPKAPSQKTPPPEVAANRPKTRPAQVPQVQQPIHQEDGEPPVMLVTASYDGPRPLGLRYSLLKLQSDGEWSEVSADSTFRSGDKIRVKVEANENGYLYIVARGSSGRWDVLFPQREIRDGDNLIEAGEPQLLPSRKGRWTFDDRKGEEKLFLVLSRKPVADLDKLIYDLNQGGKPAAKPAEGKADTKKMSTPPQSKAQELQPEKPAPPKRTMLAGNIAPIDDAIVGRLRSQMLSRDLVFEKVDDTQNAQASKKEAAVYVVEKSGKPGARLVVDIKMQHD